MGKLIAFSMPDNVSEILTRLSPGKFDATRAANFDIERAKGQVSQFAVERVLNIDRTTRTADLALATDQPIEHYFGMVEHDVSKKAVDVDRVNKGVAPLLVNHNTDLHAGVLIPNSVELGPIVRCKAKFSRTQLGEDMLNDVEDEIRAGTSVRFLIEDMILVSNKEGEMPLYRATKWAILEVSLASIPADPDCGMGRTFDTEPAPSPVQEPVLDPPASVTRTLKNSEETMTDAEKAAQEAATIERTAAGQAPATGAALTSAASELIQRSKEIVEFAEIFGEGDLARTMIAGSTAITIDDVRSAIKAKQVAAPVVPPRDPADVAREQGGVDTGVQLARSTGYRGGALKSFKGPDALERAHRAGMFFLAAFGGNQRALAFCQEKGILSRAHSSEFNATGGILVPEEMDQNIIDLRIQYGAFRRNANVAVMASDTLIRPRRTGGLTAYFVGGGDAATESTKSWDSITLVAKDLSVLTKYEMQLSEDAVINIADDLTSEIAYAFAQKEDNCGFNGDGTNTYGGIVGVCSKILGLSATRADIAGLQVASGNAWSEIVLGDIQGVVGRLPQFARQSGNVKWYCSHEFYATVLMRLAQAVGGVTATEIQNGFGPSFFGIPVEIIEVMPHTEANDTVCLLYGNLSQAATLGDRRGTQIAMTNSDSTDFAKRIMAIRGDTRFDINVHDVGNASSTAGSRTPGPIVGLLTAAS